MNAEIELVQFPSSHTAARFHVVVNSVDVEYFVIDAKKPSANARAVPWSKAIRCGSCRFPKHSVMVDVATAAFKIKRLGLDPSSFLAEAKRLGWGEVALEKDEYDYE